MFTVARFAQQEIRTAADHVETMVDEPFDGVDEAEFARLPVDDGKHDDAEVDLHLRLLVEIVQDYFGLFATLQVEDNAHAVAVAFVADVGDAFNLLVLNQRGCVLNEAGLVYLEWNFRDDDRLAILAEFFGRCLGAQLEAAAAAREVIDDALTPEEESTRREIRARNHFDDLRQRGMGVLN